MISLLLLAACGQGNTIVESDLDGDGIPDDVDTDVGNETETFEATISSERTYAEFDGDEVVTWVEPIENVSVDLTDNGDSSSVETIFSGTFHKDATASIDHYEGDVHFVGAATAITDDVTLHDCVDLTGEWTHETSGGSVQSHITFVMDGCNSSADPEEFTDDIITVDGFHFTLDGYDGVISSDATVIDVVIVSDNCTGLCTATFTRE